jgi:hypothetical protein
VGRAPGTVCCARGDDLAALLASAPAAVVTVRALALPSMFPEDLRLAVARLPYDVTCAVAPPEAAAAVRVLGPRLGEVLIFARGELRGRLEDRDTLGAEKLLAVFKAGLSPALRGVTHWDEEESRPHPRPVVSLGLADATPAPAPVPPQAAFDEVDAAWRRRLAEYHPDRFGRVLETARLVAERESQQLSAALHAIARLRGR